MPYSIDQQWFAEIAPSLALMPQGLKRGNPDFKLAALRHDFPVMFDAFAATFEPLDEVKRVKHDITAWDGATISVYQYIPPAGSSAAGPTSAALHFHPGAFVACSVSNTDRYNALLVKESGIPMFSVEYRLAPEMSGVGIIKDAYSALQWLQSKAAEFNVDPARIAVVGESAGGGIAAGLCLYARDQGHSPMPAKQLLTYPSLDCRTPHCNPEMKPLLGWHPEEALEAWTQILHKDPNGPVDDVEGVEYIAALQNKSLHGVPDAYIEAPSLDILAPEAAVYAARLIKEAKVNVELHVYPGLQHGFDLLDPKTTAARKARALRVTALQNV